MGKHILGFAVGKYILGLAVGKYILGFTVGKYILGLPWVSIPTVRKIVPLWGTLHLPQRGNIKLT